MGYYAKVEGWFVVNGYRHRLAKTCGTHFVLSEPHAFQIGTVGTLNISVDGSLTQKDVELPEGAALDTARIPYVEVFYVPIREWAELKRQNRALTKGLKDLVEVVTQCVAAIDKVMQGPSTVERGQRIAEIRNCLELHKDMARFGPLNIDFRTGKKRKQ
jgi:hypothetical protein